MAEEFDEQLEVFFGEATSSQARVYARLLRGNWPSQAKLHGTISGPNCVYAQTLNATCRFVDRGRSDTVLAEAIVPDPCFWTPRLPFLYRVDLELRLGAEVLAETSRSFGIRPLGAKGKSLIMDSKRWVLRGAWRPMFSDQQVDEWHESESTMMIDDASDALVTEATKLGVLLACRAGGSAADVLGALRWMSRYPSVGIAVLTGVTASELKDVPKVGNLLRANFVTAEQPLTAYPWTDVVIGEVDGPADFSLKMRSCAVPVIAARLQSNISSAADVRGECDRLQSDLAPHGDFAGYVV